MKNVKFPGVMHNFMLEEKKIRTFDDLSEIELKEKAAVGKITTMTLSYLGGELVKKGFEWMLPVVLSKVTDPLWPDPQKSIEQRLEVEIYGEKVSVTMSMIVHKVIACSLLYEKLFIFSPNIRIEQRWRSSTGMHSYEFTQLDFEMRGRISEEVMDLVEGLLCGLTAHIKKGCSEELETLERDLPVLRGPFEVFDCSEPDVCECPYWLVNMPREFYDFEDFDSGRWDNFDLMIPGYGEILSGSRREYEHKKLINKMARDGVHAESYKTLLKLSREERLKPTAGAGIGVERLLRFLTGKKIMWDVQVFPRIPGEVGEL